MRKGSKPDLSLVYNIYFNGLLSFYVKHILYYFLA